MCGHHGAHLAFGEYLSDRLCWLISYSQEQNDVIIFPAAAVSDVSVLIVYHDCSVLLSSGVCTASKRAVLNEFGEAITLSWI